MEWVSLEQSTPPVSEPLALGDLKAYLNYEDDDQDSLITSLGQAARSYGEQATRRAFITQTWQGHFKDAPADSTIWLPRPKIASVVSVKYYDDANTEQTLDPSNYHVITGENGRILVTEWPTVHATRPDRYQVNWTSGYGAAGTDLPEDLIVAMKQLVNFWFDNRSPDVRGATFIGKDAQIPTPVRILFDNYKVQIKR